MEEENRKTIKRKTFVPRVPCGNDILFIIRVSYGFYTICVLDFEQKSRINAFSEAKILRYLSHVVVRNNVFPCVTSGRRFWSSANMFFSLRKRSKHSVLTPFVPKTYNQ